MNHKSNDEYLGVKMDISNLFFRPKFPIFAPMISFGKPQMTSKISAPKINLSIFNLNDILGTLGDSLKPGNLVEITFFWLISVKMGGKI